MTKGSANSPLIDRGDGERLSEFLGGLPLAIVQAGAWLQQNARGVKRYLELCEHKQVEFPNLKEAWETPLIEYSDRCLSTTWRLSFEAVREEDEHAANMLVFWSFLDRKDMWYGMFESAIQHSAELDERPMFKEALSLWLGQAAFEESSKFGFSAYEPWG